MSASTSASFAMKGGGHYNAHSGPQGLVVQESLPFIKTGVDAARFPHPTNGLFGGAYVIADFGCSEGKNSFVGMKGFIDAIRSHAPTPAAPASSAATSTSSLVEPMPIVIVHNDLPSNDWNVLIQSVQSSAHSYLDSADAKSTATSAPVNITPLACGVSFYQSILPPNSVHFSYAATTTHWLSSKPVPLTTGLQAYMDPLATDENDAFRLHAAKDWCTFLSSRSRELVDGGVFVLVSPISADAPRRWFSNWAVMAKMHDVLCAMQCETTPDAIKRRVKEFRDEKGKKAAAAAAADAKGSGLITRTERLGCSTTLFYRHPAEYLNAQLLAQCGFEVLASTCKDVPNPIEVKYDEELAGIEELEEPDEVKELEEDTTRAFVLYVRGWYDGALQSGLKSNPKKGEAIELFWRIVEAEVLREGVKSYLFPRRHLFAVLRKTQSPVAVATAAAAASVAVVSTSASSSSSVAPAGSSFSSADTTAASSATTGSDRRTSPRVSKTTPASSTPSSSSAAAAATSAAVESSSSTPTRAKRKLATASVAAATAAAATALSSDDEAAKRVRREPTAADDDADGGDEDGDGDGDEIGADDADQYEGDWEVDAITASRLMPPTDENKSGLEYRVHWKGWSHDADTWEPLAHLAKSEKLIAEFNAGLSGSEAAALVVAAAGSVGAPSVGRKTAKLRKERKPQQPRKAARAAAAATTAASTTAAGTRRQRKIKRNQNISS